jgi:hypothetical protein
MALTTGIFSNAHRLTVPAGQRFWRLDICGRERISRRERERAFGVPVWLEGDWAWAVQEFDGASEWGINSADEPGLVAFALRQALRLRAEELGWDGWFVMNEFTPFRLTRRIHAGRSSSSHSFLAASPTRGWRALSSSLS